MWSALATGFPMATSVGEATCDYGFHVPMTVTILREPNPGAARDAPRTSREPGSHFRIRRYTGQYNKELFLPVPVFGKSTRELSGHTEGNLGFV